MKIDAEKLKEVWEKIKTAIGNVSKKVWVIAAVVIVLIAAGIAIYLNTRPYAVLVTGASASEITTVTNWLEERGIKTYRYQGNDTLLVPEEQAVALKASLLTEMYSDGSPNYQLYFDNVSMLSTETERSNAWRIAVEQKMEAVVEAMDGVQSAVVSITPGEDRGYVLNTGNVVEASASVMVTMRTGKSMNNELAAAIRAYVSGGVQGLTIEDVQVIDNFYNVYSAGINNTADSSASALKLQIEQEYQNKIRTEIMTLLTSMFGEDNVRTAVNVVVEIGDSTIDEYDTWIPDWVETRDEGKGIIGSHVWGWDFNASDETTAGGVVGTETNADVPIPVEQEPTLGDTNGQLSGSGQKDYDNPNRTTHTERTAGYISDCTVAVALNSRAVETFNIEAIRNLVANAAGITGIASENMTATEYLESKISIYAGPFVEDAPLVPGTWIDQVLDVVPWWVFVAAAAGLLLFIILLVVLLVVRGKRKRKQEEEEAEQLALEEEQQAAMDGLLAAAGLPHMEAIGADVMSLQTEKSLELRQDIRQFVEENPEVAAQLLRNWLRGGEDHG